jgi:hypothetical protein
MRRGTNTYEVYPFPFVDNAYVWIRVLTQDETVRAVNTGRTKAQKELTDATQEDEMDYASKELLFKSMVKATSDKDSAGEPFFSSAEDVWELSRDELNMLLEHYNEVQRKYAPIQDLKTPEEFDKLIADLKKKPQNGMSLSTYTLRQLVWYLIVSSEISQNDNDSTSIPVSPLNETEIESPTKKADKRGIKVIE